MREPGRDNVREPGRDNVGEPGRDNVREPGRIIRRSLVVALAAGMAGRTWREGLFGPGTPLSGGPLWDRQTAIFSGIAGPLGLSGPLWASLGSPGESPADRRADRRAYPAKQSKWWCG